MRKTLKVYLLAALLAAGLPSAWGFALIGPLPPNAGGEPWQIDQIGYNLAYWENLFYSPFVTSDLGGAVWLGDIGGPHIVGEGYRRVTPTMYYAYDASFVGYFGVAGTTNCDAAFAIMNSVTNVSSYSQTLNAPGEFPNNSQAVNPMAQALYLLDLKSVTLHLIVEQLGLAEPERYTWAIHDRSLPPGCPLTTTYLVVERNLNDYDLPLALNQLVYAPYVNGVLYSYFIYEDCRSSAPFPNAMALAFSTQPLNPQYTSVAANNNEPFGGLQLGGFYTGLTRDDIAGLRYLYNSNRIDWEPTASAGGLLLFTNAQSPTTLTTIPLSVLFQYPMTNDPATLQANFPGISFLAVQTNFINFRSTNFVAYYTNLPPPFTNFVSGFPANINFTGWNPIQFGSPVISQTLSLADFIADVRTSDPAALKNKYPDLFISAVVTNDFSVVIVTNTAPYFTNQTVLPVVSNNLPAGLSNGYYFTNQPGPTIISFPQNYQYLTNIDLYLFSLQARTNDPATLQALYPNLVILTSSNALYTNVFLNIRTYYTNSVGENSGTPPHLVTVTNGYATNVFIGYTYTFGNIVTNHFFNNVWTTYTTTSITNHVGANVGSPNLTNTVTVSFYTNVPSGDLFIIPTNWCGFDVVATQPPVPTNGVSNTLVFASATYSTNTLIYTRSVYYTFTNRVFIVAPGVCNPVLVFGTNYSTNITATYNYTFGNVLTNHYFTNGLVKIYTTNVSYGGGGNLTTNGTLVSFYTNTPSGDIFIVPTNWCGYSYVTLLTNLNTITNFFAAGGITNGSVYYNQVTVSYFTNYTLSLKPGFCEAVVAFGTNYSTNLITTYNYTYAGVITNRYNPNSLATVVTTNLAAITNGLVGALTNLVGTNIVGVGVNGDFFVVPPQWCGLKILATNQNTIVTITNTVTTTISPSPDIGQTWTQTIYTVYTNTTYTVQPLICSTAPPAPTLRRGIEHIQFVRKNYDSLIGQYFDPFTNYYTMTVITNSQQVTEYYQRVITQPDFNFSAADLAVGGSVLAAFNGTVTRNINYDSSQVNTIATGPHGPGTIIGQTTFTFNEVGPIYRNGPFPDTNSFILFSPVQQTTQFPLLQWASYDISTNSIVLYPNWVSLNNLANSLYIQMLPATVPDGTNGVPYPTQTFSATGGQPPYVWSGSGVSSSFPGMSFNPATQQLTGTPTVSGTFTFVISLTDSVNRTVNYNFTVTIQ